MITSTTVSFLTNTITVSEPSPTVMNVAYSAQCASICREKRYLVPPPHRWLLRNQCLLLVPILILSYALMEGYPSPRFCERPWVRLVTALGYGKAKKQPKLENEKVISIPGGYHKRFLFFFFAKVR